VTASGRPRHVWLDGRLVPADVPHLSAADRGFQLGDGVFETMRARRGVVIEWSEHLARLHESAAALRIPLQAADELLLEGIRGLLAAEELDGDGRAPGSAPGDAALRITVSRGTIERRGLLPPGWESVEATVAIQAWAYVPPPAAILARGVHAITASIRRDPTSPLASIKTTSRADYVYAKLEAERAAVDDALFLTTDGRISEGTTANVWAIVGERLLTPPPTAAILAGTTRGWLLEHAAAPGAALIASLVAQESDLWPDDLAAADEAFLSSSVAGIVPLTAFEGRPIGSGEPGERTLALRTARERWIDERSLVVAVR
jgi:branched-chain amino acid aminotransferase